MCASVVTDCSECLCECVLCACLNIVRFVTVDLRLHDTGFKPVQSKAVRLCVNIMLWSPSLTVVVARQQYGRRHSLAKRAARTRPL